MKTLIPNAISSPQFTTYISNFPSLPRKNRSFLNFSITKPLPRYKITVLCSCSADYGGWDDLSSFDDSGESNQLNRLLSSLGIDDKKYAFVYLLGFVCALAVSRVRISSIVVFPACFLVFAVGFSFGIVKGGDLNEVMSPFRSNGSKKNKKKGFKDNEIRVLIENLRNLVELLNGFDVNIRNIKNSMRKDVDSNRISKSDLVSYVEGVESIEQAFLQAKGMIEGYMDNMVVDTSDMLNVSNQKPSDQKKEVKGQRFDVSEFIDGLWGRSFGSRPSEVKDSNMNDSRFTEASDHGSANVMDPLVEGKTTKSIPSENINTYNDDDVRVKETYGGKGVGRMAKMTFMEMDTGAKQVFNRDEYVIKDNKMRFMKNERLSFDMNNRNPVRTWELVDGFLDSDFSASLKQRRTEELFQQEQGKFKKTNGNNILYENLESREKEAYNDPRNQNGFASSPSSEISGDMLFNEYLTEANALLKQAREWLRHRGIEEDAENMLYRSTELLSKAVEMKPMSLLAVGQLGNTYLLHGELKLKLSRKLRALLAQSDSNVLERLDDEVSNREKFVDYLVNVCEECEELLVKAGRKYRLALSIDGNDMRALYNWGLALSFRAQLIADIGPEAAFDADKVYLAAIDKFDAMMSKSNAHTPDALFRWGVALQQRSRLRTRNFREKVKLLSQAKRLYEDALLMDSSNLQVKEALSTCVFELRYKNYY
ncbi:uncharacterized protein LOC112523370 [Cynara cardunculus var. scolymus]|uniref:Tetratricopeptide-like helical n=1 Tax=Cynara cardunculus var. scolymus TaxID=59895 RepID=A0A103XU03_CYNCS|nr:uncharacterized protein LOC112523370 [Cynara cardunculus var. scolymus]KVH96826.1 Tetratricopeptide-like helical [Cynara cardunculus var. scolymus]